MKRLLLLISIIVIFTISTINCYAEGTAESNTEVDNAVKNTTKLFYEGKVIELIHPILHKGNEFFFNAEELSSNLGMVIVKSKASVSIEYKGRKENFNLYQSQSSEAELDNLDNTPVTIDQELYLPFSLLKSEYGMVIKYNEDKKTVYLLSGGSSSYGYINLSYDYSLGKMSRFDVFPGESESNYQDNIVTFNHTDKSISAVITCDRLDEEALSNMRKYLNDFSSDDDVIFNKFVSYKLSYFNSMQDYYRRDFLYGMTAPGSEQFNMKVINEYKEKVFGQDSDIILYNVINSEKYVSNEEIHINITVPVLSNMTVYSFNFTLSAGELDTSNLIEVHNLLKNLKISDLPPQSDFLKLFYDIKSIYDANKGIYSSLKQPSNYSYSVLTDYEGGCEIAYPSSFVTYRENNLVPSLAYKSYRIDPNNYFSFSSQQVSDKNSAIEERINFIKDYYKASIKNVNEGTQTLNEKTFSFIKYNFEEASQNTYIQDYFIVLGTRLIHLQLNSSNVPASKEIENAFLNIAGSLRQLSVKAPDAGLTRSFSQLLNKEEGYSLISPSEWSISEIDNKDISYNSYSIKHKDYSGPFEILVNEGELNSTLSATDLLKFVTGSNTPELKKYFKKYSAPYFNRISQPLYMSFRREGNALYLYKLVNYLDSSNRGKLCYSIDIIRDKKIYSLFISVSDYMITDGKVYDQGLSSALGLMANTFKAEETKEYLERKIAGETRNKKVILVENYINRTSEKKMNLNSIECLDSQNNLLVGASNNEENYIYWIQADFHKNNLVILQKINKNDLLVSMSEKLKNTFSDRTIKKVEITKESMNILISYEDGVLKTPTSRVYEVTGYIQNNSLSWRLDRKDSPNAIKSDCRDFLQNLLGTKVSVYFDPEQDFEELSKTKEKGKMLYIPVLAQYGELSGYFVLAISPYTDRVTLDSYTPIEKINDRINKMFSTPSSDYMIYSIGMDSNDRFEFQVFMSSKYATSYKMRKIRISLNPRTNTIVID